MGVLRRGCKADLKIVAVSILLSICRVWFLVVLNVCSNAVIDWLLWLAKSVFLLRRSVGLNSGLPCIISCSRPRQSGSRSERCPIFSFMLQVPPGFMSNSCDGIDGNFSSSLAAVPASLSIIEGNIFCSVLKSNFLSNHFVWVI